MCTSYTSYENYFVALRNDFTFFILKVREGTTQILDGINKLLGSSRFRSAIHGGGMTSIVCPDGSTVDTPVSFVAQKLANGTIIGNWTIDSIEDTGASMNGFSHGPIYQGNLSMEQFYIQGETHNQQEEINLCATPVFAPISLTGQFGQDVIITILFQSNDPLDTPNSFSADVECQSV
jgi:hypothetical protein